ncbi:MAG: hypothetical protein ABIH17_01755 [Pseudomonadota bacterium]
MASEALPERWDIDTEVLVVGAGNAGLPAAIEAHTRIAHCTHSDVLPHPRM